MLKSSARFLLALLLVVGLGCPSPLDAAKIHLETVTGRGDGKDRASAIQEALLEAISKVSGVTLDAASASQLVALETSGSGKKNSFQSAESFRSEVKKRSNGIIEKWEIVKDETVGGRHNVELTVTVVKIVGAGAHESRKAISILPIRIVGEPTFLGNVVSPKDFGNSLRESLVSLLTSSRKFAVIDETFTDDVLAAVSKTAITESAVTAALREAEKLGAEFLVTGIAEGVNVYESPVTIGNKTTQIRRAAGVARIRVIRIDSGQTVLASEAELEKIPGISLFSAKIDQSVISSAAQFFSGRILETIYPLRIVSVSDSGEIAIDRGGEGVLVGSRLTVFKLGSELKDPSTGEKLGWEEVRVGDVEVVRVLSKVSYCKFIGESFVVEIGSICRLVDLKSKTTSAETKSPANAVDDLFK